MNSLFLLSKDVSVQFSVLMTAAPSRVVNAMVERPNGRRLGSTARV